MSEFEEKVLSLLEKINEKLDKLLSSGTKTSQYSSQQSTPAPSIIKPSEIVEKQEEEEKLKEKPPVEGRRVCPNCGGTAFRTEEYKSHVLFQQGGIKYFAKKYICKNCGTEV